MEGFSNRFRGGAGSIGSVQQAPKRIDFKGVSEEPSQDMGEPQPLSRQQRRARERRDRKEQK